MTLTDIRTLRDSERALAGGEYTRDVYAVHHRHVADALDALLAVVGVLHRDPAPWETGYRGVLLCFFPDTVFLTREQAEMRLASIDPETEGGDDAGA